MEAAEDQPVIVGVEHGDREALVAARVLERVVADQTHALERLAPAHLEAGGPTVELDHLTRHAVDPIKRLAQHLLKAVTLAPPGQPGQPFVELADTAEQEQGDDEQQDDEPRQDEDDGSDRGFDKLVEFDGRGLQCNDGSLSSTGTGWSAGRWRSRVLSSAVDHPTRHGGIHASMAKRTRGARPGQRRPLQRSSRPATRPTTAQAAPPSPAAPSPETGLTESEEARAAELEAAIVAEEHTAAAPAPSRRRSSRAETRERSTPGLATASEAEYAYVSRDLRRFLVLAGALLVALIAIWIIAIVTGVIAI